MVLELIEQIRNAEDKSKDLIKKSHFDAKEIIENAKRDADRLLIKIQNEAKAEKTTLIEDARKKAGNEAVALQKNNNEKIRAIQDIVNKNKKTAIDFVINNIMGK